MSEFHENYSLEKRNSFGLKVFCRYFYEATDINDLKSFFRNKPDSSPFLILGEGSNTLFKNDYPGTVICPDLKGIEVISENSEHAILNVRSGENWDNFVSYCVSNNYFGLENLSLIPGSVGAAPVQNIGAYGVEAKDFIYETEGFFTGSLETKVFSNSECSFAYRNSIFKSSLKNRFIITSVRFKLNKKPHFNLSYGPVEKEFLKLPVQDTASLRQTIISIRESKLPDPLKIGNAGSFFKNPVIPEIEFERLKSLFPEISSFPAEPGFRKIAAAWLIEKSGCKGIREGNVGTYPTQPLVIVNYGNASGKEIHNFAQKIVASVKQFSGIELEMEVNLV